MPDQTHFGQWLKRCRSEYGLTQAELAEQAGCTVSAMKKYEAGSRRPSRVLAVRLAELLHVLPEQRDAFVRSARAPARSTLAGVAAAAHRHSPHGPQLAIPPTPLLGRASDLATASALVRLSCVCSTRHTSSTAVLRL